MGFRERYPGWFFPEQDVNSESTMDQNEAAQVIATAIPCPFCGALVPVKAVPKHNQFHKALVDSGATPKPV